jgi:hypothetical protein
MRAVAELCADPPGGQGPVQRCSTGRDTAPSGRLWPCSSPAATTRIRRCSRSGCCCACTPNADFRAAIGSPGIRCPMIVNPFAGKLASHYDRRNVGAISLPGPGWRSTSSRPVGPSARLRSCWRRLGAREQSTHRHCLANPAVSDCVVHRRPARVRSVAREGMWGGSPAADRGPIRCVKIGANGFHRDLEAWRRGVGRVIGPGS